MPIICDLTYPKQKEELYEHFYKLFKYPLHDFQKWAIESTVNGCHTLACAPTGTGKSVCAEFAVEYFHSIGKKTIYCSPIKSLSNQKYHDFTEKYPHISIGILTGDIKTNPTADVLIMTTEILLNKLYQIKSTISSTNSSTSFDMDIYNELGCVVFDEIHMINDQDRGHVWENSIIMLPPHIQIIGLSATLDNPEKFAKWIETKGNLTDEPMKPIYLTRKLDRPVPLTHYSFITTTSGIFKSIKDKSVHAQINEVINKPFIIQSPETGFNEANFLKINKMCKLFDYHQVYSKRPHVLNQVSKYLVENEMLPALCYVFSRKQLEICAREITVPLLEFDSKVPYTIHYECEQMLRKLPNYQEYLHLPEYCELVELLQKGIAIHHAGMMPILREMVEILFAKGRIKMLFCTTSVAIGLNLPVKTCIFTDIYKYDGSQLCMLQSHEYVQAAGRAGRLGLDTVGNVIHLNNLFRSNDNTVSYKNMLKGAPQTLVSKFQISYNLILNLVEIGNTEYTHFANKSMRSGDIESQANQLRDQAKIVKQEMMRLENCIHQSNIDVDLTNTYIKLTEDKMKYVNKKRKEIEKQIQQIVDDNKFIQQDVETVSKYKAKHNELDSLNFQIEGTTTFMSNNVLCMVNLLENHEFMLENELTVKGTIATKLREIHCLVFANLVFNGKLDGLTACQLVNILSCFTNIKVSESMAQTTVYSKDNVVVEFVKQLNQDFLYWSGLESDLCIHTGMDYTIHYDLMDWVTDWCESDCEQTCKFILQELIKYKGIFLGDFIKALLKINNICSELQNIAEMTQNMGLLQVLKQIPAMTLKFVATTQSLYV